MTGRERGCAAIWNNYPNAETESYRIGAPAIRPIRPEDQPLLVRFHQNLSNDTVYLRYFTWLPVESRTREEQLRRQCLFDHDSEMTFVAEWVNGDEKEIVGIASLYREGFEAELAVVVTDAFQARGIGSALVSRIIALGEKLHLARIVAFVLMENMPMQTILLRFGFKFKRATGSVREGQLLLPTSTGEYAMIELGQAA